MPADPDAAACHRACREALARLPGRPGRWSARDGQGRRAAAFLALTLGFVCGHALLHGAQSLPLLVLGTLFALTGLARGLAGLAVLMTRPAPTPPPAPLPRLAPVYSVMVALRHETHMVPELLTALEALKWPRARLDLIFAVDADDPDTLHALETMRAGGHALRIVRVPDIGPRTKPRALQTALRFARGRFVAVYDAEDRPHPDQLIAAFAAFRSGPDDLGVVQAPLVAANDRESWIAGQFALDYAIWFRVMLPALSRLSRFLPLGGTSNHFRMRALAASGGWDPWNVTEDADLGARMARDGWRAALIAPPTLEEAPPDLGAWTRQRSRWIQGHVQTLAVHLRDPARLVRDAGAGTALAIGVGLLLGPASALARAPFLLALMMALLAGPADGAWTLAVLAAGAGWLCEGLAALAALRHDQRWRVAGAALTAPLYHALQLPAGLWGLWRLAVAPHTWAKTDHGAAARTRGRTDGSSHDADRAGGRRRPLRAGLVAGQPPRAARSGADDALDRNHAGDRFLDRADAGASGQSDGGDDRWAPRGRPALNDGAGRTEGPS